MRLARERADRLVGLFRGRRGAAVCDGGAAALVPAAEPGDLCAGGLRRDRTVSALYQLRDRRALVFDVCLPGDRGDRAARIGYGGAAALSAQRATLRYRRGIDPRRRGDGADRVSAELDVPCRAGVFLVGVSAVGGCGAGRDAAGRRLLQTPAPLAAQEVLFVIH